jgi:hypothetical protein
MNGPQPAKQTPPALAAPAGWWVLLIISGVAFLLLIIACVIVSEEPRSVPDIQGGMQLLLMVVGGLVAVSCLVMLLVGVAALGRQAAVAPWVAALLAGVTVASPNWATALGAAIVAAAIVLFRAGRSAPPRLDPAQGQQAS